MTILNKIPLKTVMPSQQFILKGVTSRYKYNEGERTENIIGYVYRLVNMDTYDSINVLVEQMSPVISAEDLKMANEAGQKVVVEIDGATITPYYSLQTKSIEDSVRATSIKIIQTK